MKCDQNNVHDLKNAVFSISNYSSHIFIISDQNTLPALLSITFFRCIHFMSMCLSRYLIALLLPYIEMVTFHTIIVQRNFIRCTIPLIFVSGSIKLTRDHARGEETGLKHWSEDNEDICTSLTQCVCAFLWLILLSDIRVQMDLDDFWWRVEETVLMLLAVR